MAKAIAVTGPTQPTASRKPASSAPTGESTTASDPPRTDQRDACAGAFPLDEPLDAADRTAATALADALPPAAFGLSSPARRCLETAAALRLNPNYEPVSRRVRLRKLGRPYARGTRCRGPDRDVRLDARPRARRIPANAPCHASLNPSASHASIFIET